MVKTVRLSRQAYAKVFLHAAKHFDCPLLGYLIGTVSKDSKTVEVADVLPVCHSNPAGPVLEIAGDVADAAFSVGGCKVLGIYFAPAATELEERRNIDSIDDSASAATTATALWVERVRDGVAKVTGSCVVLKVRDRLLASRERLFLEGVGMGPPVSVELTEPLPLVSALLDSLLSKKMQSQLCDFEAHMNSAPSDISDALKGVKGVKGVNVSDFRNSALNTAIQQFSQ
jgi:hypothetical protein